MKYSLINPLIENFNIKEKTPIEAANKLWLKFAENVNSPIQSYAFSIKDENNKLYHYKIEETATSKSNLNYKINEIKIDSKQEELLEKKLNDIKEEVSGGKKIKKKKTIKKKGKKNKKTLKNKKKSNDSGKSKDSDKSKDSESSESDYSSDDSDYVKKKKRYKYYDSSSSSDSDDYYLPLNYYYYYPYLYNSKVKYVNSSPVLTIDGKESYILYLL